MKRISTGEKQKKAAPHKKKPLRMCQICDKPFRQLDVHLQKAHELQRSSSDYKTFMSESVPMYEEEGEMLETESGPTQINPDDNLKKFTTEFKQHLELYTPLHDSTINREVKAVTDVVAFGLDDMPVSSLDGTLITNIFQKATKVDPPGFFREKEKTLAFSYLRKILKSCQRAAQFMFETQESFKISEARRDKTLKTLRALSVRYQKEENRERYQSQRKKEMSLLCLKEIQDILESESVRQCVMNAVNMTDEEPALATVYLPERYNDNNNGNYIFKKADGIC